MKSTKWKLDIFKKLYIGGKKTQNGENFLEFGSYQINCNDENLFHTVSYDKSIFMKNSNLFFNFFAIFLLHNV